MKITEYGNGIYRDIDKTVVQECSIESCQVFIKHLNTLQYEHKASPQDVFDLGCSILMSIVCNGLTSLHDAFGSDKEERMADMESFTRQVTGFYKQLNDATS